VCFNRVRFGGTADFSATPPALTGFFDDVRLNRGLGESFFRFAKQVCQNMGEYREAGNWYYKERCAAWYNKTFLQEGRGKWASIANPVNWFELLFVKGVFGYGEKAWHVVVTSLSVIFGCAFAFWLMSGVEDVVVSSSSDPSTLQAGICGFWKCLYFSMGTFATLGLGDLRPVQSTPMRLLAGSEAVLGAFLMAAFLVCLARRWGRG
jgi:hypothetical protein